MNSTFESNDPPVNIESAKTAEAFEPNDAVEADNEDAKFASELAWLAAASVTIASIAASVGFS